MVYINSLKKNIIPLYLQPYYDEIFTSWLYRISSEYGIKSETFLNNYLGGRNHISAKDLDLFPTIELENFLKNHTILNEMEISRMFLKKYEAVLFENFNENHLYRSIINLGVSERYRKNTQKRGLIICPLCLKNKQYLKTSWRLTTSIYCVDCDCELIDCCPSCKSQILIYKLHTIGSTSTLIKTPLNKCYYCKKTIEIFTTNKILKDYQIKINEIIESGYEEKSLYALLYFKTFFSLSNDVVSINKNNRVKNIFKDHYNIFINVDLKNINLLQLEYRKKLFPFITDFISKPNFELKQIFKYYNIKKSFIDSKNDRYPYHFIKNVYY